MKLSFFQKMVFIVFLITSSSVKLVLAQNSKTFDLKNFTSIGVSNGIDVYITQGAAESVIAKGNENALKELEIIQKDNNIQIKRKQNTSFSDNDDVKVYITLKTFTALAATGGSDVEAQGNIKANNVSIQTTGGSDIDLTLTCTNLKLASTGGSDVDLKLKCKNLEISSTGGSDVKIKGNGENMSISATGGSEIEGYNFMVENAKVAATGASEIKINVSKNLDVAATGAAKVNYKGAASVKSSQSSKSSEINHVN